MSPVPVLALAVPSLQTETQLRVLLIEIGRASKQTELCHQYKRISFLKEFHSELHLILSKIKIFNINLMANIHDLW